MLQKHQILSFKIIFLISLDICNYTRTRTMHENDEMYLSAELLPAKISLADRNH